MNTYFGFAIADGMFSDGMSMTRKVVDVETVRKMVEQGVTPALNPTHQSTIDAMRQRYALNVEIPEKAPLVKLAHGDKFIVMSVRGLPRREGGKAEYSAEEIAGATFEFSVWEVLQPPVSEEVAISREVLSRVVNFFDYAINFAQSKHDDVAAIEAAKKALGLEASQDDSSNPVAQLHSWLGKKPVPGSTATFQFAENWDSMAVQKFLTELGIAARVEVGRLNGEVIITIL